jgi:transposase
LFGKRPYQTVWLAMKVEVVPALRSKRGLRRGCGAEPQASESINSMERKADTMKTYLLKNAVTVEPKASPNQRLAPTSLAGVSSRGSQPKVLFNGLDVHTESIAVSVAPSDSTEVRRYGLIGGTHDDVLRLAKKLQAAHPGAQLRFCYEAGPHGYPLARCLQTHGYVCILVAPSKVPRQPGDRVKTNRRDADQLARLFRAGELTAIHVPDPQDEAVRDLLRARDQVRQQQHRARQQLKMFLLRHNLRYAGQTAWTPAHLRYLATIKMPFAEQQFVFQEMVDVITEAGQRLERYEKHLPGVVAGWRWEPVVKALMSLRGVALLTAATLVAELGDLRRFPTARQLMGYLGLVPSEDSTGDERKQGGITKMGNGLARRALIEAAWHYRSPARISAHLQKRQEGLPKAVTAAAWAAQARLHRRYKHLVTVGRKKPTVAAAALGRELSGFVWAIGRMMKPRALEP